MNPSARRVVILAAAFFGALAVTGVVPVATAQSDPGWDAYIGCWTSVGDGSNVLCFSESADGVALRTVVDGEVQLSETLVADGTTRTTDIDGCTGSRSVRFSTDRRRVFTRSELDCPNDTRSGSGIMTFVSATRWVDVRALSVDGEQAVWLEEYEPVPLEWFAENAIANPLPRDLTSARTRRSLSARAIGNNAVREALEHVDPAAVEMWVAVQPAEFDLDGNALIDLADGGVPESVIDFMVARSFPERFRLDLDQDLEIAEALPPPARNPGYGTVYRPRSYFFDPFYYYPGFYGYSWYDGYVYSTYPFGTYRPRPYYPYYGGGGVVIVDGDRGTPDRGGRIVNGRGYQGAATSGGVRPRSNTRTSVSPVFSAPSGSSSAGTVSAPSGSSSPTTSDSGTSTGRRARPR